MCGLLLFFKEIVLSTIEYKMLVSKIKLTAGKCPQIVALLVVGCAKSKSNDTSL